MILILFHIAFYNHPLPVSKVHETELHDFCEQYDTIRVE